MPKKKKKGKLLLATILLSVTAYAHSYFPHKPDSQEIRVIASSVDGLDSGKWKYDGQLIGVKAGDSLGFAGVYGMSKDAAYLGAEVTYSINPIVYLSLTGKYHNTNDLGGHARVYMNLELGNLSLLPFISVDHKKLGAIGVVGYFDIKGVLFSVGANYSPGIWGGHSHNVSLLLGTGFNGNFLKKE